MSWQLINHLKVPPGEYPYVQEQGIRKKFQATPLIEQQAKVVSEFRQANKLPRATFNEALEDIVAYTCQRLGGHRNWCYNTDAEYAAASPIVAKRRTGGCGGCGAHVR